MIYYMTSYAIYYIIIKFIILNFTIYFLITLFKY